jgi:uncharacterized cupredoxin-like copper-binding protein
MANDTDPQSRPRRRDGFVIIAVTCSVVALAFAIANFFVASHASDTAESAKTTADSALAAAQTSNRIPVATTVPSAAASNVPVVLNEYNIALQPSSPSAGKVTFEIANGGTINHEFVLFRTDLPANALPTKKNGDVNEDSRLLQNVADSGTDLKPGASRALHSTLNPGHYVAVCNLPGHYAAGMRIDVTVP